MSLTCEQHLQCGKALFNFAWTLIEKADRTDDETELMINASHASWMHWSKVGKPVNFARSEWQLARVYAVAGRAEPALHHAGRCLKICRENDLGGFDLAYAYEALARAEKLAGQPDEVTRYLKLADEIAETIPDAEDRKHVEEDLKGLRRDEGRGTRDEIGEEQKS